jgi:hypothetical protein
MLAHFKYHQRVIDTLFVRTRQVALYHSLSGLGYDVLGSVFSLVDNV